MTIVIIVIGIIAAHRNPEKIRRLFLEASYADTKEGLLSLYTWANRFFGKVIGPMIIFWWDLLYPGGMDQYSPANLAPDLCMSGTEVHLAYRFFACASMFLLMAKFIPV